MTEPTNAPGKSRRLSLTLWAAGGVLWFAAVVLLVVQYVRPSKPAEAAEQGPAGTAFQVGGRPAAGGLAVPASAWDPNGIGDFAFTERSGEEVTKKDLLGEPWVVGFVFTRCAGPCPRVTGQMAKLQKELDPGDARLVTMTVDPDYDTPEILTRYADAFGAEKDRWLFLTGDKTAIYRYVEEHFKMPVEEMQGEDRKPGFEVLHTTNLLLVDAKGVVRGKYNALVPEEMAKLRRDVKKLAE